MKQLASSMYCLGMTSRGIKQPGEFDISHCLTGIFSFSIPCKLFFVCTCRTLQSYWFWEAGIPACCKANWLGPTWVICNFSLFVHHCICLQVCSELWAALLLELHIHGGSPELVEQNLPSSAWAQAVSKGTAELSVHKPYTQLSAASREGLYVMCR